MVIRKKLRLHTVGIKKWIERTNEQIRASWLSWEHAVKVTCTRQTKCPHDKNYTRRKVISSIGSFYELMTLKLREIMRVMTDNLAPVLWIRHVLNHPFTPAQKHTQLFFFFKKNVVMSALTIPMKAIEQHNLCACLSVLFNISQREHCLPVNLEWIKAKVLLE